MFSNMSTHLVKVTSPLIFVVATYAVVTAIGFRYNETWSTSPALFPCLVGGLIIMLTIFQMSRDCLSLQKGIQATANATVSSTKLVIVVGIFGAYIFILLRFLPFDVATALYFVLTLSIVTRQKFSLASVSCFCLFSICLPILFSRMLLLPLPGNPSLTLELFEMIGQ